MNHSSTLKQLILNRHREELRHNATSESTFCPMAHADENWLVGATEVELSELASRGFPLYRISVQIDAISDDGSSLVAGTTAKPVEWIMTTFFCELKSNLMQRRARTMFDWGLTPDSAQWILNAAPMSVLAAFRQKRITFKASQGRNGFAACLQARSVNSNYLHLLRGISTPVSDLGHASRLSFS